MTQANGKDWLQQATKDKQGACVRVRPITYVKRYAPKVKPPHIGNDSTLYLYTDNQAVIIEHKGD